MSNGLIFSILVILFILSGVLIYLIIRAANEIETQDIIYLILYSVGLAIVLFFFFFILYNIIVKDSKIGKFWDNITTTSFSGIFGKGGAFFTDFGEDVKSSRLGNSKVVELLLLLFSIFVVVITTLNVIEYANILSEIENTEGITYNGAINWLTINSIALFLALGYLVYRLYNVTFTDAAKKKIEGSESDEYVGLLGKGGLLLTSLGENKSEE